MLRDWMASIKLILVLLLILSGFYPLVLTLLAKGLFPIQANGSLNYQNKNIIGSLLLGQEFRSPGYFSGRPSLTAYQTDEISAQHLQRWQNLQGPANHTPEMFYPSASMLDPHISWQALVQQLPRVAQARGLGLERLNTFIETHGLKNDLVNVLELNLALDQESTSDGQKTQS